MTQATDPRRYERPGRVTIDCEDDGKHWTIDWSAGYPPIDLASHLGDHASHRLNYSGDSPDQHLAVPSEQAPDPDQAA